MQRGIQIAVTSVTKKKPILTFLAETSYLEKLKATCYIHLDFLDIMILNESYKTSPHSETLIIFQVKQLQLL